MSAVWSLEENNGKQWFAGHELPMMWYVAHASLIIPADQIEGLSDKAIGRMVREALYTICLEVAEMEAERENRQRIPSKPLKAPSRIGYIYLVEGHNCYKIGKSKDLPSRIKSFGLQLPFPTHLVHSIPTADMVWAEAYMHRTFAHRRLNGEWFDLTSDDVAWICDFQRLDPDP